MGFVDKSAQGMPALPGRVLIVEDDCEPTSGLETLLIEFGFVPRISRHEPEGVLRAAREHAAEFALIHVQPAAGSGGVDLARLLRDELALRVVYLTASTDLAAMERAKHTEPYGYLLEPIRPLELRFCLELALHQARREHAERAAAASAMGLTPRSPLLSLLSAREIEVLRLIAHGHTSKDIARALQIAKPTVDTYRSRISEKLGVNSRTELVSIANRSGLLT